MRTGSRPPHPRNLAVGCLGILVIVASLALCGPAIGEVDEADPASAVDESPSE